MFRKLISAGAASLIALAALASPPAQAAQTPPDVTDRQDVETFMDGFMAAQLASRHIAGATVAVVADGQVVLVKGYGYADVKTQKPIDGGTTLFRPGSVSKLFVWTAIMQLVEQGKVDLDADVNTYLKSFKIPDAYGKPVTVLNLMTHTPGFEDSARDLFVDSDARLQPLDVYLSGHIPGRVYPPATITAYSNYGAALAGYIVQEVSGIPFEQYVERNIFEPLGMDRSTFRQPLPDSIRADMSKGYVAAGGQYTETPFEYVNAFPAGSLTAPAEDMARFMIAHLQGGELDGERILKAETAAEMHSQAWTPSPEIEGMAHGFYSTRINGLRIIQHGGDTILFHSELMLVPEENVGLFVSYNSTTGAGASVDLQAGFMDRYFPADHPVIDPPSDFNTRVDKYVGSYSLARMNYSTPEKVLGLFQSLEVSPGPDNTLMATSFRTVGGSDQWVEIRPGVLRQVGADDTMVFLDEKDGKYQTAYIGSLAPIGAIRVPWFMTTSLGLSLAAVCVLLFLTGVFAAPVGLFGPRVKPPEGETRRGLRIAARWTAFAFCLLSIAHLVGFTLLVIALSSSPGADFAPIVTLTWVPRIALPFGVAMLALGYFVWREKFWSLAGRIHYTLLAFAALAWVGFELIWRLLG